MSRPVLVLMVKGKRGGTLGISTNWITAFIPMSASVAV